MAPESWLERLPTRSAFTAFVVDPRRDSRPTSLGVLPGGNVSVATDINEDGLIVGYAQTGDGTFRAFTAGNADLTPLALTNGYASMWATAVNGPGQIAGYGRSASSGNTNGFLHTDGQTLDLGRPAGADHVLLTAVSDQGLIVGIGQFPSGARSRVVTYLDGTWNDLGHVRRWVRRGDRGQPVRTDRWPCSHQRRLACFPVFRQPGP